MLQRQRNDHTEQNAAVRVTYRKVANRIPGIRPQRKSGTPVYQLKMERISLPDRLQADPAVASDASVLLCQLALEQEVGTLVERTLQAIGDRFSAPRVQYLRNDRGDWLLEDALGDVQTHPPGNLLADALDRDGPLAEQGWCVVPLVRRDPTMGLLAVQAAPPADFTQLEAAGALLGIITLEVHRQTTTRQQIRRLQAILEIATQWNRAEQVDGLLEQMAEAACQLLEAERASIFLWDRENHLLVGRPALGIEGGELRIADDNGVVGAVIHSGQARRIDADVDEDQQVVDRSVDDETGFQTRSILCVPLRGRDHQLLGAFEVMNKQAGNFSEEDEVALTELAAHAATALENTQELEHLVQSRRAMADQAADQVKIIGESAVIEALRSTVSRVAGTELHVLVLGENGTGKEVVSQAIHYQSKRRDEPFIAVNCAAITESLLESELFGHEAGAFTDARETRQGKFELANGGTIFLDEIGDLSPGGQAKLLRVLEEKLVIRVGGSAPITTDARVIAATNKDLATMVREKKFRQDLFFRLNVVTLDLPPLRDRERDVVLLAEHFLQGFAAAAGRKKPLRLSAAAKNRLCAHLWPGNVREVRNLMERLAYLAPEDRIDADDLAFIMLPPLEQAGVVSLDNTLAEATHQFQVDYIEKHIQRAGDNLSEAARHLGLHRSNLYRKMKHLGMSTTEEE